ncbi:hypothetical protein [Steroidobacter sp.]|uniref:hypothetical protein n=1 Tax=Steroidobacter sp. TaxID=1978227 RepID=UPI001A3F5918|nr:hypothetical protein [Steroidobacter sp.]MBL8272147.1 hypothetical protein [Steroidobacter sp.]
MQLAANTPEQHGLVATARALLLLLIAADLAFIFLHVVYVETALLRGRPFSLEADNGLPEAYQYVKQYWAALLMVALFRRTRAVVYLGWTLVFTFLLLDDAFQFHEQFGKWLAANYSVPVAFGLRPDDIGELLFAGFIGGVTALLIGFGYWRGDAQARIVSRDIAVLIVLLAIVGVGVDVVHVISYFKAPMLAQFLLILEDGGEMLVVSVIAAYTFNVLIHRGRTTVDLWGVLRDFTNQRLLRRAPAAT